MAPAVKQSFKLKILSLSVKENEVSWVVKAKSILGFTETRAIYEGTVKVDVAYFAKKITELEKDIEKCEESPDLFDDWKKEQGKLQKELAKLKEEEVKLKGLEIPKFDVHVETVDYTKWVFSIRVPEATILEIVKIT